MIPLDRTATPVELDDLTASVNDLATALGPNGANADGALSDVLDTAAANLSGNGELFSETIQQLSDASAALADSRGDLFTTVDNLSKFTKALADSDAQVRSFNDKLADVSGYLADDRDDLGRRAHLARHRADRRTRVHRGEQGRHPVQCGQADRGDAGARRPAGGDRRDPRRRAARDVELPVHLRRRVRVVRDPGQPQRADVPAGADAVPHASPPARRRSCRRRSATCASSSRPTSTARWGCRRPPRRSARCRPGSCRRCRSHSST